MEGLSASAKWALMTRDIPRGVGEEDYVVGEDEIRAVLDSGRDVNLYWGTGERTQRTFFFFSWSFFFFFFSFFSDDWGSSCGILCSHDEDRRLFEGWLPCHDFVCRFARISGQCQEFVGAAAPPMQVVRAHHKVSSFSFLFSFGDFFCVMTDLVHTDTSCLSKPCDSKELLTQISFFSFLFSSFSSLLNFVFLFQRDAEACRGASRASQVCSRHLLPAQRAVHSRRVQTRRPRHHISRPARRSRGRQAGEKKELF